MATTLVGGRKEYGAEREVVASMVLRERVLCSTRAVLRERESMAVRCSYHTCVLLLARERERMVVVTRGAPCTSIARAGCSPHVHAVTCRRRARCGTWAEEGSGVG